MNVHRYEEEFDEEEGEEESGEEEGQDEGAADDNDDDDDEQLVRLGDNDEPIPMRRIAWRRPVMMQNRPYRGVLQEMMDAGHPYRGMQQWRRDNGGGGGGENDDDDDGEEEVGVEEDEGVRFGAAYDEPMRRMARNPVMQDRPYRGALQEMMDVIEHREMQQWRHDDDGDDDEDEEDDDVSEGSSSSSPSVRSARARSPAPHDDDDNEIRRSLGLGVQRIRRLRRSEGDNTEGDDEEEVGPWVVQINAESVEWAVSDLEALAAEDEIEALDISTLASRDEWSEQEIANHPRALQRFVELLDQPPGRIVRSVKFDGVDFNLEEERLIRAEDVERMFGTTLPLHPTLQKIEFDNCHISEAHLERFTSSLPAAATTEDDPRTPTKELVLLGLGMDAGTRIQSIADMVGRNARVSKLALSAGFHGLQPDEFRLVCSGLRHNTNLRTLKVTLFHALDDTLDLALAPNSPLEVLHIEGRLVLKDTATASLARLLKANTALVELLFAGRIGRALDEHRLDAIVAAMETSNVTVQRFSEGTSPDLGNRNYCHHHLVPESRIGKCLRRNTWIHHVLQDWPNYRVPSKALWPKVLHRADSCPTCLYRFLRRGNLPTLCDVVVGIGGQGGGDGDVDRAHRGATKRKARDE